jgi:hypothetical protein
MADCSVPWVTLPVSITLFGRWNRVAGCGLSQHSYFGLNQVAPLTERPAPASLPPRRLLSPGRGGRMPSRGLKQD